MNKDIPTILCVLSDFGAAHRSMAAALEERLGGRFRLEVVDLIEATSRFCNDSLKLYAPILRSFPRFYNFFYAANAHGKIWDFFYYTFLHRLMLDRVIEIIRESRPACVLSLCALTSRIAADALEAMGRQNDVPLMSVQGGHATPLFGKVNLPNSPPARFLAPSGARNRGALDASRRAAWRAPLPTAVAAGPHPPRERVPPLIVHVVDLYTIHPIWAEARAALSLVPTAEAAGALERMGVERRTIRIVRYPLRRRFLETPAPREALRARLGIRGRGPVALVMGGGDGLLEAEKAAGALIEADPAATVVAVAGRNEKLRVRLDAMASGSRGRLLALGYSEDVAGLMSAADLLVTKAGPSTIMEALQMELPMVLTGFVPTQEAGNIGYVRSRGMGIYLEAARLGEAGALLRDEGRLRAMREAMLEEKRALPDLDSSEQIEQYLRLNP